ncbi:MAG: ATPase, partial [Bacteroidaceae bacterium]|nr:ATPase [Bacteroidaceae bacterium]
MAISVYAFGTGGKRKKIFQDIYFSVENNHGKTKSATLQKRNVIFWSKNEMHKNYRKSHSLSGFFHLFKQCSN